MTIETGRRMWVIAVAILMWTLAGSSGLGSSAHAAPQVDPTTNFRMWGSPSFNRQIGPDDVVVQVAGGYDFTVSLLSDGSVACWGGNDDGQCDVPSGIGTPGNPVASVAADLGFLLALWGLPNPPSGDLDGDGVVGASDLGVMLANWDC